MEARPNLERVKREAKKMRKESNGSKTHTQRLEEIARRLGFESYNALKVNADSNHTPPAPCSGGPHVG